MVQRWSVGFPRKRRSLCVAFHGVQGADAETVYGSGFFPWISEAIHLASGPDVHDHAWFVDQNGLYTHVVAGYWVDQTRRDDWFEGAQVARWWNDSARHSEGPRYFRESLTVPIERLETLYWNDYPAGLSRSNEVALYPTPYCGYYGAMRDRIPLAAVDPLPPALSELPPALPRDTKLHRWRIATPHNLTVIRSAAYWGRCDPEQTEDYMRDLRARHGFSARKSRSDRVLLPAFPTNMRPCGHSRA